MMTELVTITLENEMDLTLAYKRSILTASLLGLTVATQTAFATAVSEVCREVIDKAVEGVAVIGVVVDSGRFYIITRIKCKVDEGFARNNAGFEYARKLVPVLETAQNGPQLSIELKLGIPRSNRIDHRKIAAVKKQIEEDGPVSAYEEVKQRNAALTDLNQQQELALLQASFLNQQKSEFLSVASHELSSPLTILRSYAQLALRAQAGNDAKLNDYLVKVEAQTKKMASLVQQLLDISKLEHGEITYEFDRLPVNAVVKNLFDDISLIHQHHLLELELGTDGYIKADLLRLEQVLTNLIGNAVKYSEKGSRIKINTSCHNGINRIAVVDEGIGMSTETTQQVFDKFYRAKQVRKKYNGLGMGLYIASRIIDDHQGTVAVESQEGTGSTFSISLPAVE